MVQCPRQCPSPLPPASHLTLLRMETRPSSERGRPPRARRARQIYLSSLMSLSTDGRASRARPSTAPFSKSLSAMTPSLWPRGSRSSLHRNCGRSGTLQSKVRSYWRCSTRQLEYRRSTFRWDGLPSECPNPLLWNCWSCHHQCPPRVF